MGKRRIFFGGPHYSSIPLFRYSNSPEKGREEDDLKLVREYLLRIQEEGGRVLDAGHGPLEAGKKLDLGPFREWREWPRALINVYRWDLERKNQLDAPMDISLYMKLIEEVQKMKR